MSRWKFFVEDLLRFGSLGHRLVVARLDNPMEERYSIITNMTFETLEPRAFIDPAKATLDDSRGYGPSVRDFLQAASDAAWEIGIKPKQIEDHTSELRATKFHLEDMRQLAGVKK